MLEPADARSTRLNKQSFNRRNMNIDERRAYDAMVEKRAADAGRRNIVLALVAVGAAVYQFLQAGPANAVVGRTNPPNNYYYRQLARIDEEDGGVIDPSGFAR